ncbi:MAG: MogA/MoaB family molybdenum cofactor biosynthesis protein [Anaerolineaceae bacterium]
MSIRFAILTISDRSWAGERDDLSGPALESLIQNTGWKVCIKDILPDDMELIKAKLIEWCDSGQLDVIVTSGGTGFSPRDITPEATLAIIERNAPGLSEAMRSASLKITPHGMLSRGISGIRGNSLIVNLPGSPKAAVENLQTILEVLPHAVQLLRNDPSAESTHSK